MGFEPTRAEPIGLAVQRLNHSATSSSYPSLTFLFNILSAIPIFIKIYISNPSFVCYKKNKEEQKFFPRRELNPGLLGESQIS